MTHDELLTRLNDPIAWMESESEPERHYTPETYDELKRHLDVYKALRAVVELIQEKQKFLENTKGDIPMTNQQLGAREERTKLLAEIKQAIEKELE